MYEDNPNNSEILAVTEKILRAVAQGERREEDLVPLEGKIETYVEKSSYLEAVLFEIKASYPDLLEELGLRQQIEDCAVIAKLLSDSLFVDIDESQDVQTADERAVKKISAELEKELADKFSVLKRPVKKAVMASILEKLPLDFTTTAEIENYIRTNLFGCQDSSERAAAICELEDLMSEAQEWRER
jgi:hypothetical protein